MKTKHDNMLWGAAFSNLPSSAVLSYTSGRDVVGLPPSDMALLPYDLWCNQAHVVMLAKTGIIPHDDAVKILNALGELEVLVARESFPLNFQKEDVHTHIESWLTDKLGIEIAGKLHTARSRNDQVLTDTKLYLRDQVLSFINGLFGFISTLIVLADKYKSVPMPGFTHHQHAMVTTFGHTLAGFVSMMLRDIERFKSWYTLHNQSPLGNVVSYGTTLPIDRKLSSALLGFDSPDHNSLDVITNRWEPDADLAFDIVTLMNHLSTLAETLIMFGTPEFGMLTISDEYSTGSSMMPQKKNPDTLEIVKGKAAYAHGQLMSLLSLGKGSFIGYNRDFQWSKYIIMDLVRECEYTADVLAGVISSMTIHTDVMESWCKKGFIGAPTLMEHLISKHKVPMRIAKIVVEKAVKCSVGCDVVTYAALMRSLADECIELPIAQQDVTSLQDPRTIVSLMKSYGSSGKHSMKVSLKSMRKKLFSHKNWVIAKQKGKEEAKLMLKEMIKSLEKGGE